MHHHTIKATEAARSFSQLLNKVLYQGQSFDIKRGNDIVARLVPPLSSGSTLKVEQLNSLFANLPQLTRDEKNSFKKDLTSIRKKTKKIINPWA